MTSSKIPDACSTRIEQGCSPWEPNFSARSSPQIRELNLSRKHSRYLAANSWQPWSSSYESVLPNNPQIIITPAEKAPQLSRYVPPIPPANPDVIRISRSFSGSSKCSPTAIITASAQWNPFSPSSPACISGVFFVISLSRFLPYIFY